MKNNIFINKYVMACAISIVIALVGYISMNSLAVEQYPDIAPPTVSVSTSYTGADPQTIMESVIQPLEESINGGYIFATLRRYEGWRSGVEETEQHPACTGSEEFGRQVQQ